MADSEFRFFRSKQTYASDRMVQAQDSFYYHIEFRFHSARQFLCTFGLGYIIQLHFHILNRNLMPEKNT